MNQVKAVLFDQDGTLINTFVPAMAAYSAATGRTITYNDLRPVAHLGAARNLVSALLGHEAGDDEDDRFHEVFAAGVAEISPYPGIVELFERLRELGYQLGVVTNSDARSARIVLGLQGFDQHLSVVVTSDLVRAPKPAPDSLRRALEELGLAPHEAVFVGDSQADMTAARSAGVLSVVAGWGQQVPDIIDFDLWASVPADVPALLAVT